MVSGQNSCVMSCNMCLFKGSFAENAPITQLLSVIILILSTALKSTGVTLGTIIRRFVFILVSEHPFVVLLLIQICIVYSKAKFGGYLHVSSYFRAQHRLS